MTSSEAQRLLERVILDYMSNRGLHQAGEAFSNGIQANQNRVANNSPCEAFLQVWWGKFYEAYRSRFPDDALLTTDSLDKVAETVENIVADNGLHQSYASDHTEANISNVMPVMSSPLLLTSSPVTESIDPDAMDPEILNLLSSYDTNYVLLDSSFQTDMISGLQFPEMGEMGGMLPFASDSGHQIQQVPTAPPKWNARDDRPGINLGGPMLMEPSIHAPANALPASPELYDSGNNRSLQQADHQGWPSVVLGDTYRRTPEFLPTNQQKLAPIGGLGRRSGKQPVVQEKINQLGLQFSNKVLGDTYQRTPEFLPTNQQKLAPIGGLGRRSGKQPVVQEKINQLGLQFSNKVLGDTYQRTPEFLPTNQQKLAPIGGLGRRSGKQPVVQEIINQLGLQFSNKVLGDTYQRTPEFLPTNQQKLAPIGGLRRRSGKQPVVQEKINQLELQFSNKVLGDTYQTTPEFLPTNQQKLAPIGGLRRRSGKQPVVQEKINQLGLQFSNKVLGDTYQRTPEFLPTNQQKLAPGGLRKRSGKQPAEQEKIDQLGLQFSNKCGIKRKTPLSKLASVCKKSGVAKDKTISCYSQGALVIASSSIDAWTKIATPQKDNSFKEISKLDTKMSKLLCCHFNSKGDLLATGGENGKVLIWELENNKVCSVQGHAHHVTDVRFRSNSMFATSSFDKTVKIWDATKRSNPFQNLVGHGGHVMSIDFHPTKMGLLTSCDSNDEIRLWDVNRGDCKLNFKGGISQVRFQPHLGDFLASSTGNIINIFDVETNNIKKKLHGHIKDIRSICWDMSGSFLASVSEDSARIWSVSDEKCMHELYSSGNRFQSCTFHPAYPQVLVIGSDKLFELWSPFFQDNITTPYSAHSGIITSLADSHPKMIVASVSDDQWIKIWR